MEFQDKVVLITGASSGIGAATAIYLSQQSARLALVGRKEPNLRRIALYCEKAKGIAPLALVADLTDDAEAERVVRETVERFGALHVLVNGAGVLALGGLTDCGMEAFDRVMGTNLRVAYLLTRLAAPHLARARGAVVNVSCAVGARPGAAPATAYSVSKAALEHLTRCAARDLAPEVRVNAVCPGLVHTNLLRDTGLTEDQVALFERNVTSSVPLRRPVQTDEVATLVAYLASERAATVTGACYPIDGGASVK